jgi:hypothetical protein
MTALSANSGDPIASSDSSYPLPRGEKSKDSPLIVIVRPWTNTDLSGVQSGAWTGEKLIIMGLFPSPYSDY